MRPATRMTAKALLLQGLPISQVARATGFADQSHLTRHAGVAVVADGFWSAKQGRDRLEIV
jgi:hypothetical protein